MKLLLLGSSGSTGSGLDERGQSWAEIVTRELDARLDGDLHVFHTRFYTWTPDWEEFLERALANGPFDVVVLSPTKFGFSVFSADNRVRRLLGKRAGDWFKRRADAFDSKTSIRTSAGRKGKINHVVHRAARKVIGQEPLSSAEAITDTYLRTMARLARLEDAQVILISNTDPSTVLGRRRPKLAAEVQQFRRTLQREAQRRRFDWLDRQALWTTDDGDRDEMYSDGIHSNAEMHRRISAALLALMETKLPPLPLAASPGD